MQNDGGEMNAGVEEEQETAVRALFSGWQSCAW